jgi:hypothetical protein
MDSKGNAYTTCQHWRLDVDAEGLTWVTLDKAQ